MSFIVIGTSHKHASLEALEKLAFTPKEAFDFISRVFTKGLSQGVVILSTCQRVEIYAQAPDVEAFLKELFVFKGLETGFQRFIYIMKESDAVLHLFSVASGLDSKIIGENEILGQVRRAYFQAKSFEATTPFLNRLFERALFVGRYARHESGITDAIESIASSAVALADDILGGLQSKNVFIIGAGFIARQVALLCAERKAKNVIVANRTHEKAKKIALETGAKALKFDEFYKVFAGADVLFSATSSSHLILTKDAFVRARPEPKQILIVDLALPRDIDPGLRAMPEVCLFDLDDLGGAGLLRIERIIRAQEIVKEKNNLFLEKEASLWNLRSAYDPALLP